MEGEKSQTRENVRWGLKFGLILSAVLIALVSIGYVVRPNSPNHQTLGWLPLSVGYLAGGLVCGLVLGICRPLITSLSRSILLGPVIAFPFYAIVGVVAGKPFWRWDSGSLFIAVFAAVIVGTLVGGAYWMIFTQARRLGSKE
jgi:uncharacterized membrane protein